MYYVCNIIYIYIYIRPFFTETLLFRIALFSGFELALRCANTLCIARHDERDAPNACGESGKRRKSRIRQNAVSSEYGRVVFMTF